MKKSKLEENIIKLFSYPIAYLLVGPLGIPFAEALLYDAYNKMRETIVYLDKSVRTLF